MSREGRSQPIQPSAWHGFVGNTPANGVLPPQTVFVVENPDDRRRKTPPLQPVALSGAYKFVALAAATPPPSEFVPLQERRATTSEAVVISGALKFVAAAPAVNPLEPIVVPLLERIRRTPETVAISGALGAITAPAPATPPPPVVVGADRPRPAFDEPDIHRGPVDALPPTAEVIEHGRRREFIPAPIVLSGVLAPQVAPGVNPLEPIVVPIDERGRPIALPPAVGQHGFLGNTPANFTTPPLPVSVDRTEKRRLPEPPISLSGVLAGITAAPFVAPNGPYVVPIDERRRFLAAIPPETNSGFDNVTPPSPNVVTPERRRQLPTDPTSLSGATVGVPQPVLPRGPFVVPLEERRRILAAITPPPTSIHGPAPPPIVTPPPPASHDRVDQRKRYLPLDPLSISGRLATSFPQAPAAVTIVDATTGPSVAILDRPAPGLSVQDATGHRVTVTDTSGADAAIEDATGADVTIDDLDP